MNEQLVHIDCGENLPESQVDLRSSAQDNVIRAQQSKKYKTFFLSQVMLYGECPFAVAGELKKVHIDLSPNMELESGDVDLATSSYQDAITRVIQVNQFICKPFLAACPKGFK